jgi:hypothetical protein
MKLIIIINIFNFDSVKLNVSFEKLINCMMNTTILILPEFIKNVCFEFMYYYFGMSFVFARFEQIIFTCTIKRIKEVT